MTRRTRPGTIQSAIRSAYRAVGGIECASDDLGISVTTLSYGTDVSEVRPGGLGVNYVDKLGRIEPAAAMPIAQHFSQLAGGVFTPLGAAGGSSADFADIAREFSDVVAKHADAHSAASSDPTGYTPTEAFEQMKELGDLMEVAARMYGALRERAEGRS
ncbi:hypothetical protein [Antarcticimicrobium sediminis]|uniref:Uncharacterized protein n=1 Tax=Antarcticimicrobium sediminis TaxID=2546227 RepID=A0A4R5EIG4_9RHOB|nr:hypothetical protein [Antarcticimicrobium sediminis]TDE34147.1 hypothetical protein E1B25_20370 [Antarcticimicrobium sediminis]